MRLSHKPFEILLVEDNKGDIGLIEKFFENAKIGTNLHVAEDGEEAIRFLCGEDKFLSFLCPDIIILDWNLPKKTGHEVLREIKRNSNLKSIPIIIFTTSRDEKDVLTAYDLNANAYIVKPIDSEEFMKAIGSIEDFWLKTVTLPFKNDQKLNLNNVIVHSV